MQVHHRKSPIYHKYRTI